MVIAANPVRNDNVGSAAPPRLVAAQTANPAELAQKLLNESGGAKKPNLSEIQRKLDAITIQDRELGTQVRAEVEKLLTPVQRGQLASATYMQDGVLIDPNAKSPDEQFRASSGSADRANYNALDKMYGDGNLATNDSARISKKIQEQIASGLPLDKFLAQDRAVEKDWVAKTGDFLANFSPSGLILEAAQPGIAALGKSAGLGNTEWGGHLQRILDTPGTARAFNAGIQEGMLNGAKDFVTGIVSMAGKAIQYAGDVSPSGLIGDAARRATPDAVKGWLRDIGVAGTINAVVPSANRGYENTQALAKAGETVGKYFASRTPGQVAEDVKAKIDQMWDGIKADHAKAMAQGPEAEARWWGNIVGRATFEVASTFVPVAGQAGKVAKTAQLADKAADAIRVTDAAGDLARAGDKAADAVRAADEAGDAARAASKADEPAKLARPDIVDGRVQRYFDTPGKKGAWNKALNGKLEPNADYHVNGYTYRTDAKGRVSSVEGQLRLNTSDRNGYQQSVAGRADRLPDDEGGHLIASIFNGPGEAINLKAMNGNFNKGAFKALENKLADALADGKKVEVKVDAIHSGDSARPIGFRFEYHIDGVKSVRNFENKPGG